MESQYRSLAAKLQTKALSLKGRYRLSSQPSPANLPELPSGRSVHSGPNAALPHTAAAHLILRNHLRELFLASIVACSLAACSAVVLSTAVLSLVAFVLLAHTFSILVLTVSALNSANTFV